MVVRLETPWTPERSDATGTYPRYSAYCYPPLDVQAGGGLGDGFTEGVNAYVSAGDLYNWRQGTYPCMYPERLRESLTGVVLESESSNQDAQLSMLGAKWQVVAGASYATSCVY